MSDGLHRRPRVVLLHPQGFSERDMQWYVPLLDDFDIVAVTPRLRPKDRVYQGIPQAQLLSLDQIVGASGPLQHFLDKVVRLRSENLYWYFGLEPLFASADIVECLETFHPYCWQAVQGKRRHSYGLVFSVHENIAFAHENLQARRRIKQEVFAFADAFTPISEQGANSLILEGAPEHRIHIAGAALDTDRYTPGTPDSVGIAALNIPTRHDDVRVVRLLWAGRFVWEKGGQDVLESIALLKRQAASPNIKFHLAMAGDGPERNKIAALAGRMGLSADDVTFIGRVNSDQMINLYRWADICIVPSVPTPRWQEQFGCILIEAMACGCPIIASDSGAIGEVVGSTAVLVGPNQHTTLAGTIDALARNVEARRQMAADGRSRVVDRFDNRVIARRIAGVYRSVLAGRSATNRGNA